VPHRGAWVQRIDPPIRQAVESHRRRPGGRHAKHDAEPVLPAAPPAVRPVRGQGRAEQRERQREQRMTELDQLEVWANS